MEFSKREFNWSSADGRNRDRKLNAEVSKRFREELPRPLVPSQASRPRVRSPRPVLVQGGGRDVPSTVSVTRSPPSEQVSLKPTLIACSAMLAIAVGLFIGITIAGVDIDQVASVTGRLVQLVGASEDALKQGQAAAMLNDPTVEAQPSQPSSQAQTTEPAALADQSSLETAPSSAQPLRSIDLTPAAVVTPDQGQINSVGKHENVPPGVTVAASPQLSLLPVPDERNSELYR
jgi:hypothetical protein